MGKSDVTISGIQGNPIKAETLDLGQDGYVLTWVNVNGEWEAKPTARLVNWAGDLLGSNDGYQWVGSISGASGSGGNISLNISSMTAAGDLNIQSNSGDLELSVNNPKQVKIKSYALGLDSGGYGNSFTIQTLQANSSISISPSSGTTYFSSEYNTPTIQSGGQLNLSSVGPYSTMAFATGNSPIDTWMFAQPYLSRLIIDPSFRSSVDNGYCVINNSWETAAFSVGRNPSDSSSSPTGSCVFLLLDTVGTGSQCLGTTSNGEIFDNSANVITTTTFPISATLPTAGQILVFDGYNWVPTLPISQINIITSGGTTPNVNYTNLCNFSTPDTMIAPNPVVAGGKFTTKDISGNASTNNIAINPFGSETFDGAANGLINTNYGSVTYISDGTNWWSVSQ